jgi:hypothetical protein
MSRRTLAPRCIFTELTQRPTSNSAFAIWRRFHTLPAPLRAR